MNTANVTLLDQVMAELRALPADAVREVLDFAGYLRMKRQSAPQPAVGSAAALLKSWGTWEIDPDESAELDAYIQAAREMPDTER
jgi:hypothetical protein